MQSIGGIFLYTADQELAHARRFYELLKPETGTTIFIDGSYPVDEPGSVQDLLQAAATMKMKRRWMCIRLLRE